jgi:hypothetical protein
VSAFRRRTFLTASIIIGILAGLYLAASVSAESSFEPAAPGEETYDVGDIAVEYPVEGGGVQLSFGFSWSGTTYPGPADCRITVLDSAGKIVDEIMVNLDSLQPTSSANLGSTVDLNVAGVPVRADASCAVARTPDSTDRYSFTDLKIQVDADGVFLHGIVNWPGDGPPDTQQCTLTATFASGEVQTYPFTLGVSDDFLFDVQLPDTFSEASDPAATCKVFSSPLSNEVR